MRVIAFAGPSLPPAARSAFPGVEWRPPVEAGDLLRLDAGPGTTICLIDGYFDHRPAVRHKEIMLLLSAGVRVLGAASILVPVAQMGFVFTALVGVAMFGERLDGRKQIGLLVAAGALALFAFS